MKFLEKNLEDIIWEASNEKLQERGLNISGKKFRQLRIGNYGVADLVTIERKYFEGKKSIPYLDITVYELKKEKAGISAFLQAIRYCQGIKSYLIKHKQDIYFNLNIVLCAEKIDTDSDYIYISELVHNNDISFATLKSIRNYSFKINIDGIYFIEEKNHNLINKGF
jgi:hypothetical protein